MGTSYKLVQVLGVGLAILAGGCEAEGELSSEALNQQRQAYVDTLNGLRTINGLRTLNGLRSVNGLSTTNGLRSVNGLRTINGLRTVNGMRSVNGLSVDCTGKTPGVSCTGEPDGLLSAATGLMSSDDGINTAKYLVRCALKAGDAVTIKDYTGALIRLDGELGLTTGWGEGQCDGVCEEKISACLLAFTNGSGENVPLEMSAHYKNADGKSGTADDSVLTIGTGHSAAFPEEEGSFYGNVFKDPPEAYYCSQSNNIFAVIPLVGNILTVDVRACGGYVDVIGLGASFQSACPIKSMGDCKQIVSTIQTLLIPHPKCSEKNGAKTKCESGAGTGPFGAVLSIFNNKTWNYPMTTWVQ